LCRNEAAVRSIAQRRRTPIIAVVARRIHVRHLQLGQPVALDSSEAHHARDVLRLADGAGVEVFDDAGAVGRGVLILSGDGAFVRVEEDGVVPSPAVGVSLVVAAAVPKGDRADWMVEKLSELGVAEFVPLAAARSVVLPEGRGKRDRWLRIATEAAKQSRRVGVMRITELMAMNNAIARATPAGAAWFLSTEEEQGTPIGHALARLPRGQAITAFIGPEGGWTVQERQRFTAAGAIPVWLTRTILRVETAAVATAAAVACLAAGGAPPGALDDAAAPDDDPAEEDAPTTGTPP
jgi:16S rRNA (uracil1498-N3)-methyltransferase